MYNPGNPNSGLFRAPGIHGPIWGSNRMSPIAGPMSIPGQPQGPSGPNAPPMGRPAAPAGYRSPAMQQPQQAPQPLLGNVTGTITPMSIFSPQMTNQAANLAQADYERAASPNYLLKQFDRPGVSRSAGSMSAAIPLMAQLRGQGALEAANVRAGDEMANRQSMLQGQQAQSAEGLNLMQLLSMIQGVGRNNQMNQFNMGLGLLQGLL